MEHQGRTLQRLDHVRGNTARLGEPQTPTQTGQNGVCVQILQPDVQQTLFTAYTRTQPSANGQLPVRDVLQVVQKAGQPATTQVSVEIALSPCKSYIYIIVPTYNTHIICIYIYKNYHYTIPLLLLYYTYITLYILYYLYVYTYCIPLLIGTAVYINKYCRRQCRIWGCESHLLLPEFV